MDLGRFRLWTVVPIVKDMAGVLDVTALAATRDKTRPMRNAKHAAVQVAAKSADVAVWRG
jgi:hypothetical protein